MLLHRIRGSLQRSDRTNEGTETITPEVDNFGCGRNENNARVVGAGTVKNPFTQEAEAVFHLEIDVIANGAVVETIVLDRTFPHYDWDDSDLGDAWEVISENEYTVEQGPFECEVAEATLTKLGG